MIQVLLALVLLFPLSLPISAQVVDDDGGQTPEQALKVRCNKHWHVYMKQNHLKGYDKKAYMAQCQAGQISLPAQSRR